MEEQPICPRCRRPSYTSFGICWRCQDQLQQISLQKQQLKIQKRISKNNQYHHVEPEHRRFDFEPEYHQSSGGTLFVAFLIFNAVIVLIGTIFYLIGSIFSWIVSLGPISIILAIIGLIGLILYLRSNKTE